MRTSFTIELDDFGDLSSPDQQDIYLDALTPLLRANMAWLALGRRWATLPRLYQSGVRFAISPEERAGVDNRWPNIPIILAAGVAHCVGLTCWRVAELRVRDNIDARPCVTEFLEQIPGVGLVQEFHVCVSLPDGSVEDPSKILGMP